VTRVGYSLNASRNIERAFEFLAVRDPGSAAAATERYLIPTTRLARIRG
jgi:hypothetical protein